MGRSPETPHSGQEAPGSSQPGLYSLTPVTLFTGMLSSLPPSSKSPKPANDPCLLGGFGGYFPHGPRAPCYSPELSLPLRAHRRFPHPSSSPSSYLLLPSEVGTSGPGNHPRPVANSEGARLFGLTPHSCALHDYNFENNFNSLPWVPP